MLTEAQLNELLAIFLERSQSVVEEYLIRMGDQIREIGELIPSSVNRLVQLKKMNANLDAVKREIARLAEISAEDLQRVFEAAQETDARFVAKTFGNEFRPSILDSPALKQILSAQLEVTFGQMKNLSQTTIISDAYRNAVDKAIQAAQMGVEDYNKSIRRALEEAAGEGLKVEIGKTGAYESRIGYGGKYTRRLDSAIRQNVLDGIRSLSNATMDELGREFGANGIELSAHMLCAEDHLPHQGKQYSFEEFARLQQSLLNQGLRPFFIWNCKHSKHPILLGISEPAYSDEELEEYRRFSSEQITIDGITKSRYQWTQEQRKIETAVRRQKDVSVCARASGDGKLRRDAQRTINALMDRYDKVTEAAGLRTEYDRMRVAGFKHTSEKELGAAAAIRNTGKRVYFDANKSYSVILKGREEKVNKGISLACRDVAYKGSETETEHMYLVNLSTGKLDFYETNHLRSEVGYKFREYIKNNKTSKFAFVHNHNTDSSFSEADMRTLFTTESIPVMIAVRNDGVIYVAERAGAVLETGYFDPMYEGEIKHLKKLLDDGIITMSERTIKREEMLVRNLLRDFSKEGMVEFGEE